MTTATLSAGKPAAVDPACAKAVDVAREAAVEIGRSTVGEHLGYEGDGDRIVTHYFASTDPGYVGWRWAVTVVRASRAKVVTVDEVGLLPGDGALLAPPWVPWSERLRPGDLGPGDLLPTAVDDERLVPAYNSYDAGETALADELRWELGLDRVRVLSRDGRDDATDRWYSGDHGPDAPIAKAAPGPCGTCGFLYPLAGALRGAFGVCANEYAPDDGRVVSVDHGCGAHSEAVPPALSDEPLSIPGDDYTFEPAERGADRHPEGSVSDAEPSEPFGHS